MFWLFSVIGSGGMGVLGPTGAPLPPPANRLPPLANRPMPKLEEPLTPPPALKPPEQPQVSKDGVEVQQQADPHQQHMADLDTATQHAQSTTALPSNLSMARIDGAFNDSTRNLGVEPSEDFRQPIELDDIGLTVHADPEQQGETIERADMALAEKPQGVVQAGELLDANKQRVDQQAELADKVGGNLAQTFAGGLTTATGLAAAQLGQTRNVVAGGAALDPTNTSNVGVAINFGNLNNSGVGMTLTASHNFVDAIAYQDDGRLLQSQARQIGGGVAISSLTPFQGGIWGDKTASVAYARVIPPDVNGVELARKNPPPTQAQLAANPSLLKSGEEISYKGKFSMGLSAGMVDPTSGVSLAVDFKRQHEWQVGIKASGGDSYKVRVEPGTTSVSGGAGAGWGPFSVSAGVGGTKGVYFEFTMTGPALQQYLKTGELPALPKPDEVLTDDGKMKPGSFDRDVFNAKLKNKQGATLEGVTLEGFGHSRVGKVHVEASASVAALRDTHARGKIMHATSGEVLMVRSKEATIKTSALFRGEKEVTMAVDYCYKFQASAQDKETLHRTYEGIRVTSRISDTKTSKGEFEARIRNLGNLLGRDLPTPQVKAGHGSSVEMKASITPEHLRALAAMGKDHPALDDALKAVPADKRPALRQELTSLIENVALAGADTVLPEKAMQAMATHQTTLDQELLKNQGKVVANFMTAGDVHIAALDRLMGAYRDDQFEPLPPVVTVENSTSSYRERIDKQKLGGHLDAPVSLADKLLPNTHWSHFNNTADKLHMLRGVKADLEKDDNIDATEKQALLKEIGDYTQLLDADMGKLLGDDKQRLQVAAQLVNGGTRTEFFADPDSGLGLYYDKAGMFNDGAVKNEFLDRVAGAAIASKQPEEMAQLVNVLMSRSSSEAGAKQVLDVLNAAARQGVLDKVVASTWPDVVGEQAKRMSPEQRGQLVELLRQDPARLAAVNKQRGPDEFNKIQP